MKSSRKREQPPPLSSSAPSRVGHRRTAPAPGTASSLLPPPPPPSSSSSTIGKKRATTGGGGAMIRGGGACDSIDVIGTADVAAGGGNGGGGGGCGGMLLDVPIMSADDVNAKVPPTQDSFYSDFPPPLLRQMWQDHHRRQQGGEDDDGITEEEEEYDGPSSSLNQRKIMMAMARTREGHNSTANAGGVRRGDANRHDATASSIRSIYTNVSDSSRSSSSSGQGGGRGGGRILHRKGSANTGGGGVKGPGRKASDDGGSGVKRGGGGGQRKSSRRASKGGGGNGGDGGMLRRLEEAMDMPHLDDILRRNDAAGGMGGGGGGARSSGGTKVKKAVIFDVDDDDVECGGASHHQSSGDPTRRHLREALQRKPPQWRDARRTTLDKELLSIGASDAMGTTRGGVEEDMRKSRSTVFFEALWGGMTVSTDDVNGSVDDDFDDVVPRRKVKVGGKVRLTSIDDEDHSSPSSRFSADDSLDGDDYDENKRPPLKLLRTMSGKVVGFMRSDSVTATSWNKSVKGGGHYDQLGRCSNIVSNVKLMVLCVVFSIAMAVMVGALVAMVPLWMRMDERMASAELGGLAYDGDLSGGSDPGSSPASLSSSIFSTSPPAPHLKPPPYNLSVLCGQSSLDQPGGFDKCLMACLPSQCCLVPTDEPYEVWTRRTTSLVNSVRAEQQLTIGTIIQPCFQFHSDQCVQYNNQCSILGTAVLLPRRPPSKDEVAVMTDADKFQLAERINHSCGKLRHTTSGVNECQALCQEMESCFHTRRRRQRHLFEPARRQRMLDVSHAEIPGEEDFLYTQSPPEDESEGESTTTNISTTTASMTAAVSNQDLCVIYAGCNLLYEN